MARTLSEIKEEIYNGSLRRKEANYLGAGSVLDGLSTDIARVVMDLEANQESILGQAHLDTASEANIERYARDFNIARVMPSQASTNVSDRNIIISTINGDSISKALTLNNIELSGLRLCNLNKTKTFIVTNYTGNINVQSYCYVSAYSSGTGSQVNISKNELNYFEKVYTNLKVTNNFAILNGTDMESTSSLKRRITSKIESNLANTNTLNQYLNSLEGYGKASVFRNFDGPGTLLVCIQPSNGLSYQASSLAYIKAKIEELLGASVRVTVKGYDPIVFKFKTRITVSTGTNAASLVVPIKNLITQYFNRLKGGDSVNLGEIENSIKQQFPSIRLLSRVNNKFEEVSYTMYEGTSAFKFIAGASSSVTVSQTQLATLSTDQDAIIVNYE